MANQRSMDTLCRNFAQGMVNDIKKNFADAHLSGNLANTMTLTKVGDCEYQIHIPAQVYDQWKFIKQGVIVYQPEKGSYAESVNEGGAQVLGKPTGNHYGYIESGIANTIKWWKRRYWLKVEGVEWK